MRWAVPLLKTSSMGLPKDHRGCRTGEPCLRCKADRYLTAEDWGVVDFFGRVQDQTVNLTPMGTGTGESVLVPRLEGWIAACDLYDVPQEVRAEIVDLARAIFEATQGRLNDRDANRATPDQMAPPEPVN